MQQHNRVERQVERLPQRYKAAFPKFYRSMYNAEINPYKDIPTPNATIWDADSILDFLYHHRAALRAMGVRRLGLFGSFVRNVQTPASDVDLLLIMDPFTWQGWMDVWNYLEDNLGLRVDLVPEKDLREELRSTVMSEVRYVAT